MRDHLAGGLPAAADLPVLLAVSSALQAASPTVRALASTPRGRSDASDHIQALTQIFAPGNDDLGRAHCLAGSFNPLIAKDLTVGKEV